MKYIGENAIKKLISLIKGDLAKKQDSITVSGLLKGDGTTISAAVAETDYMTPPTGGTTGQVLKKTETGTEWADAPQTVTIPETTALLKGDGAGGVSAAVAGTDYMVPPTGGTAGQILTKTADGQEWKDREKDLFVVNMTAESLDSIVSSDKTFDEVQAAYLAGKTVIARLDVNGIYLALSLSFCHEDNAIIFSTASGSSGEIYSIIMTPQKATFAIFRAQSHITASGLLKGNGNGGVSAAVAGTDYVAPNGDGSNVTAAFTAASARANITTGEKLSVLFGKIAKWFSDLGSLAFKSTVAKSDLANDVQTSLGKADSALQSVSKSDVGLGNVANERQYSSENPPPYPVTSVNGKTGAVTVSIPTPPVTTSLIKGDGSGGLVAATRGSDYIASGNIVKQTLVASESTPTENYAINWVYG